jgi:hypothetical protein
MLDAIYVFVNKGSLPSFVFFQSGQESEAIISLGLFVILKDSEGTRSAGVICTLPSLSGAP